MVSDLAAHCREVTDFLIKDAELTKVEVDEMWSFIKKSKRTPAKESLTGLKMVTRQSFALACVLAED